MSHPVWVRGLKHRDNGQKRIKRWSHPVWVRGLKPHHEPTEVIRSYGSHPVWVRGLKQSGDRVLIVDTSRTPCGCVD